MIGFVVLGVFILLIAVILLRAALLKPEERLKGELELPNDERAQKYGKMLSAMIQKDTVSSRFDPDRTKFYEFHELLEDMFPLLHQTCEKKVFDGSLLFRWPGGKEKEPILLMSHHDTVEAGGEWEHGPFSGDIDEQGRVWGRGTVDTKGSLFCILQAVEELLGEGYVPERDVYIASSCTEEWTGNGAALTVEYLKEQGLHFALVMDEGGMIIEEPIAGAKGIYGMVGVLEKGYGDVRFVAKGQGGHSSAPVKNTPLIRLGKFMTAVEKKSPFKQRMNDTILEMFKRVAPNVSFGLRVVLANMWLFKPLLTALLPTINSTAGAMIKTTIGFTMAKGADGLNVFPQEAWVTGNMRFIPHQPTDESIEIIAEVAKKYDIETEVIYKDYPCPEVSYKSDAFHMLEEIGAEVYPEVCICPYVMTGGTDSKVYQCLTDNCLRFAPLYIDKKQYEGIHALNENIYQGALVKGVDFYRKVITFPL